MSGLSPGWLLDPDGNIAPQGWATRRLPRGKIDGHRLTTLPSNVRCRCGEEQNPAYRSACFSVCASSPLALPLLL